MSSNDPAGMDQLFVNIPSSIHAPPQTPLPFLSQPNSSWNTVLDQDEYEDDLPDLPPSASKKDNKQIRRRSSKACDQCRKSKCKCERPGSSDEPCKNCVLLGTPCTFLGPSRKRGPPKGYIDAIESRLHQMEALLGTLLSSGDPRARSLIDDLTGDPLANEILSRVDESPFGTRGKPGDILENRASRIVRTSLSTSSTGTRPFAGPSADWQDNLKERLKTGAGKVSDPMSSLPRLNLVTDMRRSSRASLGGSSNHDRDLAGESPRQRRRLDSHTGHVHDRSGRVTPSLSPASASSSDEGDDEELASAVGQLSLNEDSQLRYHGQVSGLHILGQSDRLDKRNEGGIWRFPKAGVWPRAPPRRSQREWEAQERARLPSKEVQQELFDLYFAYVHPVLPVMQQKQFWRDYKGEADSDWKASPSPGQPYQYVLLNPEHVAPHQWAQRVLDSMPNAVTNPVVTDTRPSITDVSNNVNAAGANSADTIPPQKSKAATKVIVPGENRVPTLLLLAMFAVAARYRATLEAPIPASEGVMWNAGDDYLEDAKGILNQTYASSRPSTCQALLLLSYREIGIGAMAQAWLYVGMAVRMAQDLGMHRYADRWQRTGSELFSETERQVRKRIWYSCVIMDKYVSTYIGRPLSIFERDFDTPLPGEDPDEENELWLKHNSACPGETTPEDELSSSYVPVPTHIISCFNASARLSGILSNIVESIYAVHPPPTHSRHTESALLEKRLDKWYVELPKHLQLNCASNAMPPPHVLTLHMQYWCSVLLVHRPFIRRKLQQGGTQYSLENDDAEANASCRKAFNMCAMASTRISNIVMKYKENFCLRRSPAFLTYYVFSAGIMHMTTLSVRPVDVQAALGLQQCMDALQAMNTIWPSAGRAWELLHGAKIDMREVELSRQAQWRHDKRKRMSEEVIGREVTLSEPSDAAGAQGANGANGVMAASSLSSLQLGNGEMRLGVQTTMRTAEQQQQPQQPQQQLLPQQQQQQQQSQPQPQQPQHQRQQQQHQYTLGLEASRPPANAFPDFDRWPTQEGFKYPSEVSGDMGITQFVDSGNYDSPKDLWKDFPEQLSDPSLITSSLYGLPVMSGPLQGQTAPFMSDFASMYNNVQSASGSSTQ